MTPAIATRRHAAAPLAEQTLMLTRHLQHCHSARGRLFQAAAWAELAHALMAPRFVTTVSLVVVVLLACTW